CGTGTRLRQYRTRLFLRGGTGRSGPAPARNDAPALLPSRRESYPPFATAGAATRRGLAARRDGGLAGVSRLAFPGDLRRGSAPTASFLPRARDPGRDSLPAFPRRYRN